MNKEKTAMQILFELIDSEVIRLSKIKGEHKKVAEQCANQLVILKMKANNNNLLKKEQEQIERAFESGVTDVFDSAFDKDGVKGSGETYYQSNYGGQDENT